MLFLRQKVLGIVFHVARQYNEYVKITKSFTPKSPGDWRKWLERNHDREQEIWLVYYKPSSGKSNIDYETSVEEALCFGWIDSIIQKIDDQKYVRKFNPRRPGSNWSETNKRRTVKVIGEGRMTCAGLAKITFDVDQVNLERPKVARIKQPLKIPQKVERGLKSKAGAWAAFQKTPSALKRNYIFWLMDAKKQETFDRRLKAVIQDLLSAQPTSLH